ncbi:MAG: TonB-dependent receptor [Bryobacterales bacterium]|nr:TonB-dependent receptor [Bryobacterales bacterium]
MNIEVSSVAKKEQRLSQIAAAVFVITSDDIRRSGATSIPEVLRMAPGVQVARIDSSKWAITARGFNSRFANKMLVLIDGRSVYTNLFSGVYWDQNDVLLEDIDRIEVIRGPGATLWGANAVNGVINIITRSAKQSQGGLISLGASHEDLALGSVRYGGKIGRKAFYRLYTKHARHNSLLDENGRNFGDRWDQTRGGARLDWELNDRDALAFHGDVYSGSSAQAYSPQYFSPQLLSTPLAAIGSAGGYALSRFTRRYSSRSELAIQAYFSQENRHETIVGFANVRTLDFDLQHRFALTGRHDLTWGVGTRRIANNVDTVVFKPATPVQGLSSSFVQDDISLIEDRLTLTVGSKFLYTGFGGLELQPNARLLWAPTRHQSLWTSVSRAVRTPSGRDRELTLPFVLPNSSGAMQPAMLLGNPRILSERLISFEGGYRIQPGPKIALDLAAFYSHYHGLQSILIGDPYAEDTGAGYRIVVPFHYANGDHAAAKGLETIVTYSPLPSWKITGWHSWMAMKVTHEIPTFETVSARPPQHQFHLRSSLDLTTRLSLDALAYRTAALPDTAIPGYTRLDVRLGFKITPSLELSLGGRNLANARHPEFVSPDEYVRPAQSRRSAFVTLIQRF